MACYNNDSFTLEIGPREQNESRNNQSALGSFLSFPAGRNLKINS